MDQEPFDRLAKIESHLAHLERQFDELNEVVLSHGKQLSKLTAQVQKLSQSLDTMEWDRIKANNPKPPHHL